MSPAAEAPEVLLRAAHSELGFDRGELRPAGDPPPGADDSDWLEKGDWLALAKITGADTVFFVDNNPVVVFAKCASPDPDGLRKLFNAIWCMARPQVLFLASPGQLLVLNLKRPPAKHAEALDGEQRVLAIARTAADVQSRLQQFRREMVESGRLFADSQFEEADSRADQSLIRDLKAVRSELLATNLDMECAHALIGRSIFVRYLEDRGILIPDYFASVAAANPEWSCLLNSAPDRPDLDPEMEDLLYPRVLSDKEFTYALFQQLAVDFNGDMFAADHLEAEKRDVTQAHLSLLQRMLRGDADPDRRLFFYAYKFDIVPIDLISSIYEEFYSGEQGRGNTQGSHYTPRELVEFLLSKLLTPDRLSRNPRVLDPACGSGAFLVEAFRRIVRYRVKCQNGKLLSRSQLCAILRDQIAGIDVNLEAVRITAFSLYLALLHYQHPPDIRHRKRLPNLIWHDRKDDEPDRHFNILLHANSFDVDSAVRDEGVRCRFASACTDIVAGNPPWGYPKKSDKVGLKHARVAIEWCQGHGHAIGDQELSQAFVHRALDLLRDNGSAGLLVSTGALLKRQDNSRGFRRQWLSSVVLEHVVNFTHVRDVFFAGPGREAHSIAPFASVIFRKGNAGTENAVIEYWSAKKTALLAGLRAVVLSRADCRLLTQRDAMQDDELWKILWWGSHHDKALIRMLRLNTRLVDHTDLVVDSGSGFKGGDEEDAGWLQEFKEYPAKELDRYADIDASKYCCVPPRVARTRERRLFEGLRMLVKHGPSQSDGRNGVIVARLETEPYCVRHSVYSFPLADDLFRARILLGIVWSSVARYYLFMTASAWGTWHDKISLDEVRGLPIRFPQDPGLGQRIAGLVDDLRSAEPDSQDAFMSVPGTPRADRTPLERELDEAVFDLYELTEPERDLVRDMCDIGLDLLYRHVDSIAVAPLPLDQPKRSWGIADDLSSGAAPGMEAYLRVLLESWNRELDSSEEFRWHVVRPGDNPAMLAVILSLQLKHEPLPAPQDTGDTGWLSLLSNLEAASVQPFDSRGVYVDGVVRILTDKDVTIIKRNERRLWTRSMAREDAEATLLQAIRLQYHPTVRETGPFGAWFTLSFV